jgi:hypothetical protein
MHFVKKYCETLDGSFSVSFVSITPNVLSGLNRGYSLTKLYDSLHMILPLASFSFACSISVGCPSSTEVSYVGWDGRYHLCRCRTARSGTYCGT